MNAQIAMIGLGVMGRNLALNLAAQGRVVAVFDRDAGRLQAMAGTPGVVTCATPLAAVQALPTPRALLLMVPAGAPVDEAIAMLTPHLGAGDILLDGGNSHFRDTIRRAKELAGRGIHFLGLGISGGEAGALLGPSIMAGGPASAWARVADHFQAIAARHQGAACCAWLGGDGAGHFVKMVHNGIEYAEMQVIAEIYSMLRDMLGLSAYDMAKVFERWNAGELGSYLIEITADILLRRDGPIISGAGGQPLIDLIVDSARQKGTGQWASIAAMELGAAAPTLSEAVAARHLSAIKAERETLAASLGHKHLRYAGDAPAMIANLADALLGARIAIYAQGFQIIVAARTAFAWPALHLVDVARVWQGGCIIRARLLDDIRSGFAALPDANLLHVPAIGDKLQRVESGWRRAVGAAVGHGVAIPALASALAWTDGMRTARSGANLIQAQRDYFGAHGLERTDQPGDIHIDWSAKS